MARSRNIKPSIMANEELAELDPLDRLLFIFLWMLADREGRLEDRPKRIAAQALAYDRGADADLMIARLASAGFVKRYMVDGVPYLQITNFAKHQAPHGTEKDSEIPDEEGLITVHERARNGYASGVTTRISRSLTLEGVGSDGGANSALTVKPLSDNALIPDSLIPDSNTPLTPQGGRAHRSSKREFPLCPHSQIIELYRSALPELPGVKLMDEKRKKSMRGFWEWVLSSKKSDGTARAETVEEALTWIAAYFERVRLNDFLMGRGSKAPGHEGWRCDFDFLLTDKGKKHVIEKTAEAGA